MAKKESGNFIVNFLKDTIRSEIVDNTKKKIREIVRLVIKTSTTSIISFVAVIFILVGLANIIEKAYSLASGMGYIIVGGGLLVLALIIKAFY